MDEHWQKGKSLAEANLYMLENKILCDVTFLVGKKQQKEQAHRYMLTSRSPVFFAMFCGPLAESSDVIEVPDIEPDTFEILLRYMYAEQCDILEDNVVAILYGASKYEVMGLIQKCSDFLKEYISPDTVCAILQQGVTFGANELIENCLVYILKKPEKVFESDDFVAIDKVTLKLILQSDFLYMDEEKVCYFCMKWAEQECERHSVEASNGNLRDALGDALYLIRFPCISEVNLRELEPPRRLLTEKEHSALLKDKTDGTQSMAGVFIYRNRLLKEPVLFPRFGDDFDQDYSYDNNQIDAISFACSEGTYMRGVSIYNPCDPGLLQGKLDLYEGDNVIYSEHHRIVLSYSRNKSDTIGFEEPVPLKKGVIYTLKLQLHGKKTYCGKNGMQEINIGHLTVRFLDSNVEESSTNIESGQIHGLLLHV